MLTIKEALEYIGKKGVYRTESCLRHLCNDKKFHGAIRQNTPRGHVWMIPSEDLLYYFFER